MPEGQMSQSTYLQIDACPARIDALEDGKADQTALAAETAAREAADATHDALLADLIDSGAKNLLNVFDASSGQTATIAGVTWTVNADGTVTANGTATANSFFYILPNNTNVVLSQGATVMTGCPAGGGETTYEMQTVTVGGAIRHDYGSGAEQVGGYSYRYVALTVRNGYTADNLVFKPMVCLKAAHDLTPKFVPYTPTLSELYAMIRNGSAASVSSLQQTAQLTQNETEEETR